MTAIIYQITNTVNHKTYIGLTTKSLDQRWRAHLNSAISKSSQYIHRAICKYGNENFTREILEETDSCLMNERERHWIDIIQPQYNMTLGGEGELGYTHTDRTKALLKEKRNRRPPASQDTRNKMSRARMGIPMPEGTGAKISAAQKGRPGVTPTPENLEKRSATMKAIIAEK
jgi:group I intron endonuclease